MAEKWKGYYGGQAFVGDIATGGAGLMEEFSGMPGLFQIDLQKDLARQVVPGTYYGQQTTTPEEDYTMSGTLGIPGAGGGSVSGLQQQARGEAKELSEQMISGLIEDIESQQELARLGTLDVARGSQAGQFAKQYGLAQQQAGSGLASGIGALQGQQLQLAQARDISDIMMKGQATQSQLEQAKAQAKAKQPELEMQLYQQLLGSGLDVARTQEALASGQFSRSMQQRALQQQELSREQTQQAMQDISRGNVRLEDLQIKYPYANFDLLL